MLGDPFLTTEEGHVKMLHNASQHVLLIRSDTILNPFFKKRRCVTS